MSLSDSDLPEILEAARVLRCILHETPPDLNSPEARGRMPLIRHGWGVLRARLCPSDPTTTKHNPDLALADLPPRTALLLRNIWSEMVQLMSWANCIPRPEQRVSLLVLLDDALALDGPPSPRCRLAIQGDQVLLDGTTVLLELTGDRRLDALAYVRALLAARGDWRSSDNLAAAEPRLQGVRLDRLHDALPKRLRDVIETRRGCGHRLLWRN
jgi:hypothetical protein